MVKFFTVEIRLDGFTEPIVFDNAFATYQVGNLFCVMNLENQLKTKKYFYPLSKITQIEIGASND